MSSNQQQLIKQYFNSLVQEFIKDSLHKNITIVFVDFLGNSSEGKTEGKTEEFRRGDKVKYAINFLNEYESQDQWREIVAHEFAHLYLFTTTRKHDHDDRFYSSMERFESWLDNRWDLIPRKNRYYDKNQHVDINKRGRQSLPSKQDNNNLGSSLTLGVGGTLLIGIISYLSISTLIHYFYRKISLQFNAIFNSRIPFLLNS